MLDGLALPVWVGTAGPAAGLGLLIVIMVARGWLVPGSTVDRLVQSQRDLQETHKQRADEWRDAARTTQAQLDELIEQGKTTIAVLESLQSAAGRVRLERDRPRR